MNVCLYENIDYYTIKVIDNINMNINTYIYMNIYRNPVLTLWLSKTNYPFKTS